MVEMISFFTFSFDEWKYIISTIWFIWFNHSKQSLTQILIILWNSSGNMTCDEQQFQIKIRIAYYKAGKQSCFN